MRAIVILSLFVLACAPALTPATPPTPPPAPPNRVCTIIAASDHTLTCTDEGRGVGPGHVDIAKIEGDGGSKMCWESFDRAGLSCTVMVFSKGETAQIAVAQERERAAKEAADKAKQEAPAAATPTGPKTPPPIAPVKK